MVKRKQRSTSGDTVAVGKSGRKPDSCDRHEESGEGSRSEAPPSRGLAGRSRREAGLTQRSEVIFQGHNPGRIKKKPRARVWETSEGPDPCTLHLACFLAVLADRTQTQRDDHVRTQGEVGHLQVKERDFRRNQPFRHLDVGLPASRTVSKYISVV